MLGWFKKKFKKQESDAPTEDAVADDLNTNDPCAELEFSPEEATTADEKSLVITPEQQAKEDPADSVPVDEEIELPKTDLPSEPEPEPEPEPELEEAADALPVRR